MMAMSFIVDLRSNCSCVILWVIVASTASGSKEAKLCAPSRTKLRVSVMQ